MKKIINFPEGGKATAAEQQRIEDEALAWLITLDGDTPPSKQQLQELKAWMARSPAHTREIENLGAFWADLSLTELNIPVVKPDIAPQAKPQTSRLKQRQPWLMAASLFGFMLLLQQLMWPGLFAGPIERSNGIYASAIGKQIEVPLADGSVVHLNTNSQIKVDYGEAYRTIYLIQGEAHFSVAKNRAKPFRVFAGKGRVQAVGTAFTVYLREQDIDVLVTEGKVELAAQTATTPTPTVAPITPAATTAPAAPGNSITVPVERLGLLSEGQGATIVIAQQNKKAGSGSLKAMDANTLKQKDAWRSGLLLFTGDSLEDVVAEISRYTAVTIEIADPALKKIRIGGQFRVGDLAGMFKALETNFALQVVQQDNNRVKILAAE